MSWLLPEGETSALALSGTDWFVTAADDYIIIFTCFISFAVPTRRQIMQTLNASLVQV